MLADVYCTLISSAIYGWQIADFEFADSVAYSPACEFQIRCHIRLARELFRPMLGAQLFYLKDGGVREVRLEDGDVPEFEDELRGRIEKEREAGEGRADPR